MIEALHKLTTPALRELGASFRSGAMAKGVSAHMVQQIAGASLAGELTQGLAQLIDTGWSPSQIGTLAESIAETRERVHRPEGLFDLVLSGPEVAGIPTRDTAAVMHALIEQSEKEVLLVGYAVHRARGLFERLAKRMALRPDLKVWFCLNIQRRPRDTSLGSEIVRRFAIDFVNKHWPWEPRPDIYYDPRSVENTGTTMASLHAKCLLVDRREALITSANFTEAAQKRNIEAGVLVRYIPLVERLASYFDGLRHSLLKRCAYGARGEHR